MDVTFKEKVVLVIAGSKGLGKAIAERFLQEGAQVAIVSRSEENLKLAVRELQEKTGNNTVKGFTCDITNDFEIKTLIKDVINHFGKINILINNSGGPKPGGFKDLEESDWIHAFQLNLMSYVRMTNEVLPHMKKNHQGFIINIASSSIEQVIDDLILSNTFRNAITGFSKSLARELGEFGIMVNTIGPGKFATERVELLDNKAAERQHVSYADIRKRNEATIPLGRYGTPNELANLVLFLCSDYNQYITGQSIVIDGGKGTAL
ncbi:SDR family oxidoreductase [Bacillus sp. FJAT-45350]|uniref:SDR family oxidoreductase n=1 Tax=Bacillus sp. FJAT-45350 TaxID=2011014 RepID=UPI000BB8050B|nr:SDR family oxidoreductase [Bacillus sp. FJAT-45350]